MPSPTDHYIQSQLDYKSYKQIAVDIKIKCIFMEKRVPDFNLHLWKKSQTQF